jgi:hypothetical protein
VIPRRRSACTSSPQTKHSPAAFLESPRAARQWLDWNLASKARLVFGPLVSADAATCTAGRELPLNRASRACANLS